MELNLYVCDKSAVPTVKLNSGAAHQSITYILFHGWPLPTTERSKIGEIVPTIIVVIPEVSATKIDADFRALQNLLPVVVISIDTRVSAEAFNSFN